VEIRQADQIGRRKRRIELAGQDLGVRQPDPEGDDRARVAQLKLI